MTSAGPLVDRWAGLVARVTPAADPAAAAALGQRLLTAYGGSDRAYHDLRHLTEVLDRIDELAAWAASANLVRLAAWFHDAVYDTHDATPGAAEEASARLAEESLPALGIGAADVAEVGRLVRLTTTHDPVAGDRDGEVLCDADLAVLARDAAGYRDYAAAVRREYAHVPDDAFAAGRAAILRALLDQGDLFRTPVARSRWEAAARANVGAELERLSLAGPA
jgi:predicted metal-dependent HD superfamily phosphohydrolase